MLRFGVVLPVPLTGAFPASSSLIVAVLVFLRTKGRVDEDEVSVVCVLLEMYESRNALWDMSARNVFLYRWLANVE